jgi:DNA-binding transcriptional MerR regulator
MGLYLTTAEVAEHYRTSPGTVRYWRHTGYGPRGVKVGRRVLYQREEIERFDAETATQQEATARGGAA